MENGLIIVKQLPVIEDQLAAVKESITARVNEALSLVCTEETYKDIKKVRSELNKEYAELESRRKEVKAAIMEPYEKFESVYKDCAGDLYADADRKLKAKIGEVENGLKQQKIDALVAYFNEYRESIGLGDDFVTIENAGIRVGLSDSLTGLKKKAAGFLDKVQADLKAMQDADNPDEFIAEYKKCFDLAETLNVIGARRRAIAEAKAAREAQEAAMQQQAKAEDAIAEALMVQAAQDAPADALTAPVAAPAPMEEVVSVQVEIGAPAAPEAVQQYTTTFAVTGTLEELRALKRFLTEGGYQYEQL